MCNTIYRPVGTQTNGLPKPLTGPKPGETGNIAAPPPPPPAPPPPAELAPKDQNTCLPNSYPRQGANGSAGSCEQLHVFPSKPQPEAGQSGGTIDAGQIPSVKKLQPVFPSNNNADVVKLGSPKEVRTFLNSFVQTDKQRVDNNQHQRAGLECTSASLIASAMLTGDQGLGQLVDLMLRKDELNPGLLQPQEKEFLNNLKTQIALGSVTRGELEQLQGVLANEMENTDTYTKGITHSLLFNTVNQFLVVPVEPPPTDPSAPKNQWSDLAKAMKAQDIEIISVPIVDDKGTPDPSDDQGGGHAVVRIGQAEIYDPWPKADGQQLTSDPDQVRHYQQQHQAELQADVKEYGNPLMHLNSIPSPPMRPKETE